MSYINQRAVLLHAREDESLMKVFAANPRVRDDIVFPNNFRTEIFG